MIHNGVELFDGAAEAMIEFRRASGPVVILTNAPRPSAVIPAQLDRIGLPREAYDAIVTSGDATRAAIAARLPGKAFRLGPDKDDALYEGMTIDFAEAADADFVVCTGLVDDQKDRPDDYRPLLERLRSRRLPMVCANPDRLVRWGGKLVYCAGALAEIYEGLGGSVTYGGKPYRPIYDLAAARIDALRGDGAAPARVLAVGDGLATDIAGANCMGYDAVYVAGAGGVHDGVAGGGDVARALDEAGVSAVAVMESLKW